MLLVAGGTRPAQDEWARAQQVRREQRGMGQQAGDSSRLGTSGHGQQPEDSLSPLPASGCIASPPSSEASSFPTGSGTKNQPH